MGPGGKYRCAGAGGGTIIAWNVRHAGRFDPPFDPPEPGPEPILSSGAGTVHPPISGTKDTKNAKPSVFIRCPAFSRSPWTSPVQLEFVRLIASRHFRAGSPAIAGHRLLGSGDGAGWITTADDGRRGSPRCRSSGFFGLGQSSVAALRWSHASGRIERSAPRPVNPRSALGRSPRRSSAAAAV